MNTYNFNVKKGETHNFDLIMGFPYYSDIYISNSHKFDLILDEFKENKSFLIKIITPILIRISELKSTLFTNVSVNLLENIITSIHLKEYYYPILRVRNIIKVFPSFLQYETVSIKTPLNIIIFIAKEVLKIDGVNIIISNRITAISTLKRYKYLSEFDPQLLEDLDDFLLQEMDYELL